MPEARRETIHRMTRRCDGWDYLQRAIYQVTLVQADRARSLLGRLVIDDPKAPPEAVTARIEPSELGVAILAHWKRLGDFTPEIKPLFCQLMPDHLHAILEVTRPMAKPLGNAIGGFKTGCEKIYRELALSAQNKALSAQDKELAPSARNKGGEGWAAAVGETGGGWACCEPEARVSGGGRACCEPEARVSGDGRACCEPEAPCSVPEARASGVSGGSRLWAPGFQDSILFRAGQLDAMFNYLRDNPRRLAVKRLYPSLFRVVGALRRPLPGLGGVGAFAALGNRFLLDRPLVQVQVSRRDFAYRREPKRGGGLKIVRDAAGVPAVAAESAAFVAKSEALLARARQGAALLSPCVSEGEREIARRAFAEGLPLVVLRNKGFAPLEKPGGRHFDACAAGRLLMLAPAAWPHVPGEKPMTRRDALVLNRLAQCIAEGGRGPGACAPGTEQGAPGTEQGAAPITYRGVTFAEVDDWARAAVNLAPEPGARPGPQARVCLASERRVCSAPEAPCPVPEAPCPAPEAPCPVPEAPCSVPEAPCSVPEAPCPVPEAQASGNGREKREAFR